jgi:ABC-2 type transport system permease protein
MPTLLAAHAAVATVTATVGAVLMTLASVATYDAVLPESWPGVVAAYALVSAAFAALGALLGFWLPTARAAQGLGILLFFVFMLLGGAGPPREALPGTLAFVGDLLPLTYAAQAVRAPWLTGGWDHSAAAMMLGLLAGALALTAWRVRAEQVR